MAGHLCNSGSQHRTRIERVEAEAQCQRPEERGGGRIADIHVRSLSALGGL